MDKITLQKLVKISKTGIFYSTQLLKSYEIEDFEMMGPKIFGRERETDERRSQW